MSKIVETLLFSCDNCDSMFIELDHECDTYEGKKN